MKFVFALLGVSVIGIIISAIVVELGEQLRKHLKKSDRSSDRDFWSRMPAFLVFSILVAFVWFAAFFAMPYFYGEPDGPGMAGDMFGAVTSLFSGLAFAGLISTLLMQRSELALQREELRSSRSEFSRQRFENTFFGLVELFNSHVNSLTKDLGASFSHPNQIANGREVLRHYAKMLPDELYVEKGESDGVGGHLSHRWATRSLEDQIASYERLYDKTFEPDLGPYFRLFYNALRHVEHSDLNQTEKLRYSKILRAYLSSAEVKLIAFNCASHHGEGLRPWIVSHSLLTHIHADAVARNIALLEYYPAEAYDLRPRLIQVLNEGLQVPEKPPTWTDL